VPAELEVGHGFDAADHVRAHRHEKFRVVDALVGRPCGGGISADQGLNGDRRRSVHNRLQTRHYRIDQTIAERQQAYKCGRENFPRSFQQENYQANREPEE